MPSILIIDDDRHMSDLLFEVVVDIGCSAKIAYTLSNGLEKASAGGFDVILLDVCLPDGRGDEKLKTFLSLPSSPEVIIITAHGDRNGAQIALESGAWDYLSKSSTISEIRLAVQRAIQYREQRAPAPAVPNDLKLEGLVWKGDKMAACIGHLAMAAKSEAGVLITGETGTGKELFARAIHDNSSRADRSFVIVDCASLPPSLAESLLFGHQKGAFTGADRDVDGLFRQADGGTLFLDEVGELPAAVQKSFLRVLQERRFRPLGAKHETGSDFRVIAATNRNLDEMASSGTFRRDLLHRIKSISIHLPPLRERPEDITELFLVLTRKLCQRYHFAPRSFAPEFLEALMAYNWPGNVRELINSLERAIAAAGQEATLYPKHLPTHIRLHTFGQDLRPDVNVAGFPHRTLKEARDSAILSVEEKYLSELFLFTKGDLAEACRISGLSTPQMYAQLKKHKLSRKNFLV